MNPALREFWATPSRIKVLYGGRASSKSWDAAANSVRIAQFAKVRILCARMFQNKIEESVYNTIKTQVFRFGLEKEFTFQNNKIICNTTGSEYLFYGLARNVDEIKSLEGIDICWLEEAHNLTPEMWEILEPTIRKQNSEIWVIFNPRYATDFAYKKFVANPPPNSIKRKINYPENPFLSDTLRGVIQALKRKDIDEYNHIYGGEPRTDDDSVIIKRSWILSAIDAHKRLKIDPVGQKQTGYDIADSGDDYNATVTRHGIHVHDSDEWKGKIDDMMGNISRAYKTASEQGSHLVYDSIGVGAGCGSKIAEINQSKETAISYSPFNAGGKVHRPDSYYKHKIKNKDHFSNAKAQAWWTVADRFRATYEAIQTGVISDETELISICGKISNLEKLIDELSSPRAEFDSAGRVKVESKDAMAKRGIASPNIADAFIMAFAPTPNSSIFTFS